jgi:hypothetical protein
VFLASKNPEAKISMNRKEFDPEQERTLDRLSEKRESYYFGMVPQLFSDFI